MKCEDVLRIRKALGLSQTQLAMLLGVHFMSISNWETKDPPKNAMVRSLLLALEAAVKTNPNIGKQASETARTHGIGAAMYVVLREAFGPAPVAVKAPMPSVQTSDDEGMF